MSYSDEWLKYIHDKRHRPIEPVPAVAPRWNHDTGSTTWKPWSEMTAEERRKALVQREGKS